MSSAIDPGAPWRLDLPLPIRTERLELRSCREGDGARIADAIAEPVDELYPWFHDGLRPHAEETSPIWQEEVACQSLARFKARERLQFLAWTRAGALVGSVELFDPDWRRRSFKLAYWMRTSVHRQGYGLEAVAAVTRYAFDVLDTRRMTVGHAEPNIASAALIAKLGFREISRIPLGSELPDGTFVDGISYAMTDTSALIPVTVSWG